MDRIQTAAMGERRSRPKLGLALIVSFFLFGISEISSAASGYYGPTRVGRHGHSSSSDGGRITNLSVDNRITVPTIVLSSNPATPSQNVWHVNATSEPISTSSITFTVPRSSVTYEIICNLRWLTSAGNLLVRFNNDNTAGKHFWGGFEALADQTTGATSGSSESGTTQCGFQLSTTIAVNAPVFFSMKFATDPGDSKGVTGVAQMSYVRNDGKHASSTGSCFYNNTTVSSVAVYASAGAFKGQCRRVELGR